MVKLKEELTTRPEPAMTGQARRPITLGLPMTVKGDRLFPLTPEAVRQLTEETRLKVKIERHYPAAIHYSDSAFTTAGAEITERSEALGCDIVVSLDPITKMEIKQLKRGATVLGLWSPGSLTHDEVEALNARGVTLIALNLVGDDRDRTRKPVADTLSEIAGRSAMTIVAATLADRTTGKGILLGGVAGLVPCEVVVIGAGTAGKAAAASATGLGATVRLFDDDPYRLRSAIEMLHGAVIPSSLHRNVYLHALASADVVIDTMEGSGKAARIDSEDTKILKQGVVIIDVTEHPGHKFPSLKIRHLSHVPLIPIPGTEDWREKERVCHYGACTVVPRTVAMALSNSLVPLLEKVAANRCFVDAIKLSKGLQQGVLMVAGKVVNREFAEDTDSRFMDLNIYLQLS